MANDDRFEQLLREAAENYHRPGETPRRAMQLRLQQVRLARKPSAERRLLRLLAWPAGIAALLALGVGLGRLSVKRWSAAAPAAATPSRAAADSSVSTAAYRITMAEHLAQTEEFLTLFRASVRRGTIDPLASATARPLLATSRLLLDSPAGADPDARALLEDLELVLVRITQLSPRPKREDVQLITSGMEQMGVMMRLRDRAPEEI